MCALHCGDFEVRDLQAIGDNSQHLARDITTDRFAITTTPIMFDSISDCIGRFISLGFLSHCGVGSRNILTGLERTQSNNIGLQFTIQFWHISTDFPHCGVGSRNFSTGQGSLYHNRQVPEQFLRLAEQGEESIQRLIDTDSGIAILEPAQFWQDRFQRLPLHQTGLQQYRSGPHTQVLHQALPPHCGVGSRFSLTGQGGKCLTLHCVDTAIYSIDSTQIPKLEYNFSSWHNNFQGFPIAPHCGVGSRRFFTGPGDNWDSTIDYRWTLQQTSIFAETALPTLDKIRQVWYSFIPGFFFWRVSNWSGNQLLNWERGNKTEETLDILRPHLILTAVFSLLLLASLALEQCRYLHHFWYNFLQRFCILPEFQNRFNFDTASTENIEPTTHTNLNLGLTTATVKGLCTVSGIPGPKSRGKHHSTRCGRTWIFHISFCVSVLLTVFSLRFA